MRLWFLKGPVCKTSERTTNVMVVGGDGSLTLLNLLPFPFYGSSQFCRAEAADRQPISDKKDENRSGQALSLSLLEVFPLPFPNHTPFPFPKVKEKERRAPFSAPTGSQWMTDWLSVALDSQPNVTSDPTPETCPVRCDFVKWNGWILRSTLVISVFLCDGAYSTV